MSYGAGFSVGDTVQVVNHRITIIAPDEWGGGVFDSIDVGLVGKIGKVVEVFDDRYDSSNPNGSEQVYLDISFSPDSLIRCLNINFCRKIDLSGQIEYNL